VKCDQGVSAIHGSSTVPAPGKNSLKRETRFDPALPNLLPRGDSALTIEASATANPAENRLEIQAAASNNRLRNPLKNKKRHAVSAAWHVYRMDFKSLF
jgi:hypothetical protein